MKKPKARLVYWVFVLLALLVVAAMRIAVIWPGNLTFLDQGLLVVLALVVLLPLIAEFEGFGVRIKAKLDEVKNDVTRQLSELRIALTTSIKNDIRIGTSLSRDEKDKLLADLLREADVARGGGALTLTPIDEIRGDVPRDHVDMFAVRYALERELRRISHERGLPAGPREYISMIGMIDELAQRGEVLRDSARAFHVVRGITNRAVHGLNVSPEDIRFVSETAPRILASLRSVRRPDP